MGKLTVTELELRGIRFQNNPHPQTKLVRVLHRAIYDVVVGLRKDSPTFKKWTAHMISAENHKQILIPNGFGHAFVTLEDNTSVLYKFDDYYDGKLVRTIRWNDPDIAIDWKGSDFIMSDGDRNAVTLSESDVNFSMEENK
ncbi:MAG: dTDP-4-dehydrorhamnose 3,5-epimerase family protein [Oscillospiraceae bacterium]|nr:dTDP-4-dehydrorhamnose 3,5-epimerase family protein [Oscillospiraceae bacterium]